MRLKNRFFNKSAGQKIPVGIHYHRGLLLFVVLAVFLGCILAQIFLKTPSAMIAGKQESFNLSGVWQECIPPLQSTEQRPNEKSCSWKERQLPKSISPFELKGSSGWIIYRTKVIAPDFCLKVDSICRLILGEVGDSLEVQLNGQTIGQHGGLPPHDRYARHYPVSIDVPSFIFHPKGQENSLTLYVRYLKKAQSGVLRGPFALVSPSVAIPVVQTIFSQNVLIPFICGLAILLIAILSWLSVTFNRIGDPRLVAFLKYGFVSGCFLLSYSSIPREYLPLNFSGCLHFILRFAMDWTYFECLVLMTGWMSRLKVPMRIGYLIFISLIIFAYAIDPWAGFLSEFTGYSGAVRLSAWLDFPLVFGPYFYGAVAMIATRKTQRSAVVGLVVLLSILSLCGTLTFHGVLGFPHFVIFYPFFVVLILGIDLWSDYLFTHERLLRESELGKMAAQVAHDIRSPLAALSAAESNLQALSEDTRVLIRSSIGRIRDVANDLLFTHRKTLLEVTSGEENIKEPVKKLESCLVGVLVESVLSEKRVQYRSRLGIDLSADLNEGSYGLSALVQSAEFMRVLSNLINNAVEAFESDGQVRVSVTTDGKYILVEVHDNGRGIPEHILSKLGERGETFGKEGGSGLGLFYAKKKMQDWNGRFEIDSAANRGTSVKLMLPMTKPPEWFTSELILSPALQVVILDDDASIHNIWKSRFSPPIFRESSIQFFHFANSLDFRAWVESQKGNSHRLYLVDYELIGSPESGLDLVESLGIAKESVLVTSRYEEPLVLARCKQLGVRIVPKTMAGFVPLRFLEKKEHWDAVLLDDDSLIRSLWIHSAQASGIRLKRFWACKRSSQ